MARVPTLVALGQWVLNDGKEEGLRAIIPFLDTSDLLSMSLVSRKGCSFREFIRFLQLAPLYNDDDSSLFRFSTSLRRLETLYVGKWSLMSDCFLGIRASGNRVLTTLDFSRMTLDEPCHISSLYYVPKTVTTLVLPLGFPEPSSTFIDAIARDACPSLKTLIVSPACLDEPFLRSVPKLEHLELRGVDIRHNVFDDIYHCSRLGTLLIDRCGMHGRNESLMAVLGSGRLNHLHTFTLQYHGYNVGSLGQILSSGKLPALQHLSLQASLDSDEATNRVIAGITNFAKLASVDLSNNILNPGHIHLLTRTPRLWFRTMRCLDLSATGLTAQSARILAGALVSAVNLVHLIISENMEMGDEGCASIAGALHQCPKLTKLDASCCSLDVKTVAALSSYFSTTACKIKSLDLSYNYPEQDGTITTVLACIPESTENLVLTRTLVGRRDISTLCARLASGDLCNLVALNLQENIIHPEEVLRIARSVGKTSCPRLKLLRL
jgi:hypothetical protein